jgi:hypothetical protein
LSWGGKNMWVGKTTKKEEEKKEGEKKRDTI